MTTLLCEKCGRQIPASNMLLHKVRCMSARRSTNNNAAMTNNASTFNSDGALNLATLSSNLPSRGPASAPVYAVPTMQGSLIDFQQQAVQQPNSNGAAAAPLLPSAAAASSNDERLRCRISSDVEELALLHEVYGWVPGAEHVRPTPEVRAQKELLLANLGSMWLSPAHWVYHHVFGSSTTRGADGKRSAALPLACSTVFARNPFPYAVPPGTEHWVFWMASAEAEWPEARITAAVHEAVEARGGGSFVWYPNPKMSLPDALLYHVQVFWRPDVPQQSPR